MVPFEEHPRYERCPKCDNWLDDWTVRYHESGHQSLDFQSYPPMRLEHLDWSCPTCGYSVMTSPADAAAPVPA